MATPDGKKPKEEEESSKKKMVYLEVCKFEKKRLPVGKYFFCECHRLEYNDRYVVC